MARYTVIGGVPKKAWFYLDDERRDRGFRVYLVRDTKTSQQFWAADFQLRGVLLSDYKMVRIDTVTTRGEAFKEARTMLRQIALPAPAKTTP